MGHTRPHDLSDVQEILDEIRQWEHIREKSPNVFYYRSKAFLHFHDKDGVRWADVLDGKTWGEVLELPFGATAGRKRAFLKEVTRRYRVLHPG